MTLNLNGEAKEFDALAPGCTLLQFVGEMKLQGDRVAVELNGDIVPRRRWPEVRLNNGDKLEVVHFVGGG